jgi:hypothetical protein
MTRALALVAAALLITATVTHHWLHHWDDPFGLFAFYPAGRPAIPYTRIIDVWRESNFDVITTYAFVVAGVTIAVASAITALALVALTWLHLRWLRRTAWVSLALGCAACVVFLYSKPDFGDVGPDGGPSVVTRYHASWSLIAFGAGVALAVIALRRFNRA